MIPGRIKVCKVCISNPLNQRRREGSQEVVAHSRGEEIGSRNHSLAIMILELLRGRAHSNPCSCDSGIGVPFLGTILGKQDERVMGQVGLAWWEGPGEEQWARGRLMSSGLETEAAG